MRNKYILIIKWVFQLVEYGMGGLNIFKIHQNSNAEIRDDMIGDFILM